MIRRYLIPSCYLGIWELSRQELKENNSIGIDIRLEAVGVVILHPDNLRSLWTHREKKKHKVWHFLFLSLSLVHFLCLTTPKVSFICFSGIKAVLLTIHRMDPDGCSTWCEPLHLAFTVARPKSPIFTVSPSCKKMSTLLSRIHSWSTVRKHRSWPVWGLQSIPLWKSMLNFKHL